MRFSTCQHLRTLKRLEASAHKVCSSSKLTRSSFPIHRSVCSCFRVGGPFVPPGTPLPRVPRVDPFLGFLSFQRYRIRCPFLDNQQANCRRFHSTGYAFPPMRFLTSLTAFSTEHSTSLFHPASTPRIHSSEVSPSTQSSHFSVPAPLLLLPLSHSNENGSASGFCSA